MTTFSETLLDEARRPSNLGVDEYAHAVGVADYGGGAPRMKVYLRIHEGRLSRVMFDAGGCAVLVAAGSALTKLAHGKTILQCQSIEATEIAATLDGVPVEKFICLEVATAALRNALCAAVDAAKPEVEQMNEYEYGRQVPTSSPLAMSMEREPTILERLVEAMPPCAARYDVDREKGVFFCADPRVATPRNLVWPSWCMRCETVHRSKPEKLLPFVLVPERTGPCRHLGEFKELRSCPSCKGNVQIKVFRCSHEAHLETTLVDCQSCSDFEQ